MSTWLSRNPKLRRKIAGYAPRVLWFRLSFLRAQKGFILVIGMGIGVIYYLAPFTYDSADQWIYLTVAIQLLAIWGALITAGSLARITVEMAIVEEVEERGAKHLSEIRSGQKNRLNPDQMTDTLLPNNPSQPSPAMIRLFQQICKEAKDRQFEAGINLIQPYREESLGPLFKLQNLQKIALWLGILGTFIGLLLAIKARNVGPMQKSEDFLAVIDQMFQSISLSFSASLAGLEVAVILGLFLLLLRKQQEVYFQQMETAVVTMLLLARNSLVDDDYLNDFKQVTTSVQQLSARVYDQTAAARDQTKQIEQGLKKLVETKGEFNSFLKQLSQAQGEFINDVKRLYDVVSLKDLEGTLQQSILDAGKKISAALAPTAQLAQQLETFNKSAQALIRDMPGHLNKASENTKSLENLIKAQAAENSRSLENLVKAMASENAKLVNALGQKLQESLGSGGLSRGSLSELQVLVRELGHLEVSKDQSRINVPSRKKRFWSFLSFFNDR